MLEPALLTRMSRRPNSFSIASAIRDASSARDMSPLMNARRPRRSFAMRAATASSGSFRRPVSITLAPSWRSASAPASPMPLPAPVTHATLPSTVDEHPVGKADSRQPAASEIPLRALACRATTDIGALSPAWRLGPQQSSRRGTLRTHSLRLAIPDAAVIRNICRAAVRRRRWKGRSASHIRYDPKVLREDSHGASRRVVIVENMGTRFSNTQEFPAEAQMTS